MSTSPDYLFEDPPIPNQKYVCISILTNKNFKQEADKPPNTIRTIKIRGCYDTIEDAKKRAEYLRNCDPNGVSVFVADVGKWLPFDDDPENAKEQDYQNKRLNEMMKGYMENQEKAKEFHEQRKNDMIMKTLKENEAKEQRNKSRQARRDAGEVVDDEAEENEFLKQHTKGPSTATVQDLEKNVVQESSAKVVNKQELSEKESIIKSKEKDIKQSKADIQKTQEEVAKYQQKNEKVKKELEEAKRIFEEMMEASKNSKLAGNK